MTAIILSAVPAGAQSTETPPQPKEKKTCRRLMPTGSFLPTRMCNTEAQWREFDGVNQQGVGEFRRALNMTSTNERNRPR
ncbi:hypothetical protein NZL82_04210 [Sphingomonas sanguinis]|uniref:hypothetical protein n=1 Tax=Sphingomonas sp. LC-1 TaxID=3110957 RepID=UPI0021BB52F5|nr:hypothetical protein [Sphingomonas sp. LC-1]MCT8001077.1 hypothetical protein [Sphingomonas sp. LC-1]